MKKLLGLLTATGLVASTSSVVVACGTTALGATVSGIEVDAELDATTVTLAVTADDIEITGTDAANWEVSTIVIVANADAGLTAAGVLTLETAGFELALGDDEEIDLGESVEFTFNVTITLTNTEETEEEIEDTTLSNVAVTATINGVQAASA